MAGRKRKSRKKKKSFGGARILLAAFLLALAAAGAAAWLILSPYGPATETFVEVAPGSSTARIGQQLEAAGVVRSRFAFEMVRLWKRGTLRAGEYRFDHPAPATEIYARIARGDVFTRSVTIPEGANIFDVATRLEQAGFGARKDFLDAAAQQTALVADLDPGAKTLEGYLFPDTYHLARKATPAQICAAMVRRFRVVAGQLGLNENVHAVVTMAALVERETAVDTERPLVASVFQNRLAKGMPLMTDPAVIYGLQLEGRWRGVIYQGDLTRDTAYNTYLHKGLPPGPIANPGARSLRAAMEPAKTDYLYFVAAGANPQGHSLFSSSLDQQNRNVAGYRHAVKRAGGR
ncbi:MAG TPA: endolytic transglycosylase MltG [Terracidiphilus sp.]|nr:endolytic transglycosylase MltG [Terracidiphilus sp.]